MTTVYHELLPQSYLLLLTPGSPKAPEYALDYSLRCASRSGKAAVWVDCELIEDLSDEAVRILWDYHYRLQEQHMELVMVHASEEVKHELLNWQMGPGLCFVPTLFDAAWQTKLNAAA
jgi:hypothetical protein